MANESNSPGTAAGGRLSQEQIQQRAYELWYRDGQPEGSDQHYWYRAERELRESAPAKLKKMPASPVSDAAKIFSAAAAEKNSRRAPGLKAT